VPATNATRPIKGCKKADFRLVYFKRKNKEMTPCIFFSGPDDVVQKSLDPTHSRHHAKKSSNPKVGIFKNQTEKTFCFFRELEQLFLYRMKGYDWINSKSL